MCIRDSSYTRPGSHRHCCWPLFVSAGNKAHIDFVADLFFVNISAGNDGSNIYTMCVFPWENGNFGSNIYALSIVDRGVEGGVKARQTPPVFTVKLPFSYAFPRKTEICIKPKVSNQVLNFGCHVLTSASVSLFASVCWFALFVSIGRILCESSFISVLESVSFNCCTLASTLDIRLAH